MPIASSPVAPPVLRSVSAPRAQGVRLHRAGLIGALNAEWARIAAGDALGGAAVPPAWAERQPALAGIGNLLELVDAATGQRADAVLTALLVLARQGDQLAARTVTQAMLGAAVRLARRTLAHAGGDLEEAVARAVSALWQVVRDYPVERRSCRPADGISLDVLGLLTRPGRHGPTEVAAGLPCDLRETGTGDSDEAAGLRGDFWSAARLPTTTECSDEQLVVLLAWGVRTGVVSRADARLLLRLHSPADPAAAISCRDVAQQLGVGHAAVRQRASRATRRLAAAVTDLARAGTRARPARTAA